MGKILWKHDGQKGKTDPKLTWCLIKNATVTPDFLQSHSTSNLKVCAEEQRIGAFIWHPVVEYVQGIPHTCKLLPK